MSETFTSPPPYPPPPKTYLLPARARGTHREGREGEGEGGFRSLGSWQYIPELTWESLMHAWSWDGVSGLSPQLQEELSVPLFRGLARSQQQGYAILLFFMSKWLKTLIHGIQDQLSRTHMISRFPTLSRSSELIRIDILYYQHFHRDSEHYRSSELHDEGKAIIVNYIFSDA